MRSQGGSQEIAVKRLCEPDVIDHPVPGIDPFPVEPEVNRFLISGCLCDVQLNLHWVGAICFGTNALSYLIFLPIGAVRGYANKESAAFTNFAPVVPHEILGEC